MFGLTIEAIVKIALLIGGAMTAAAYLVLVERWFAAWVQDRLGPNRVGIPLTKIRLFGLGQPIADGVKFIFKEEFTPKHVDKVLYFLAPTVMFMAALAVFAVVPFGAVDLGLDGVPPIHLMVAPGIDVAVIYLFAVGGLAVYGVVLGSWASNNKYAFFGGMRGAAQLIAYEIPLGLGMLGVVLASGTLRLDRIVLAQAESGMWNIFVQPLGFLVFFVAATAEAGRLPFDLPETEQELVGGYHTEYSGMKLMMYLVSEFLHMIAASFFVVILFLGGWHLWGLTGSDEVVGWPLALLRIAVLLGKVLLLILTYMWIRWSWPRFRFDQLMAMAWKGLLSLGLVNLLVVFAWWEWADPWLRGKGIPSAGLAVSVGWAVLIASWLITAALVPPYADNRPRRDEPIPLPEPIDEATVVE
ncbi:NADH-quinone oxidoreductase subunit NuoH [Thermostilla marina]